MRKILFSWLAGGVPDAVEALPVVAVLPAVGLLPVMVYTKFDGAKLTPGHVEKETWVEHGYGGARQKARTRAGGMVLS